MTTKNPNADLVTRAARASICPHCTLKHGPDRASIDHPSACELNCDLFHNLPAITTVAACTDPVLQSINQTTTPAIANRLPKTHRRQSPLYRNRHRLLALLNRLFGRNWC
jgi:hypothetical protein